MTVFSRGQLWVNNALWLFFGLVLGWCIAFGRWDFAILVVLLELAIHFGSKVGRDAVDDWYDRNG